jgi:hypothetical protein
LQGDGVYSFCVRPTTIKRRNVKASSFDKPKNDNLTGSEGKKRERLKR